MLKTLEKQLRQWRENENDENRQRGAKNNVRPVYRFVPPRKRSLHVSI
jgi:hypothetical protein